MQLLPALLLALTASTLVLRSGDRITPDEGSVREANGVITFRVNGTLYSLPSEEVVRTTETAEPAPATPKRAQIPLKLRVSDQDRRKLLEELEKNHRGIDLPPAQRVQPLPAPARAPEAKATEEQEWQWRREAKAYEEEIRRAKEELELLETRARELQWKIVQLLNLGYKPSSFTYDSSLLASTLEQIPRAQLEVTRAERAYEDFREEARRRGVLPGWLR